LQTVATYLSQVI